MRFRRWWHWHVGRRGECLLFLFLLDVLYGLSLLRPPAGAQRSATTRFLAEVMPLSWWALLWLAVGTACLAGAFRQSDRFAYAAAAALKVLWGTMFALGWLAGVVERGWVGAVVWLAFALFVMRIASWPEPRPDMRHR